MRLISKIYTSDKPNIFKRFFNFVHSLFSNKVSTIYDFPEFIKHII